ncbi:long-chain-fatty-acid--CoA ligase [Nonomuraea harbinensis]|uniref:Long-chain fatty acid--CoA ligase n=1 Tax=Nonomuraea harbinensis TaxID=1286938 RepID=A0ABW1C7S3_9ACTN|nr:long-chain fatty acid--CoA ligase [Nonomuraea harbinensis]
MANLAVMLEGAAATHPDRVAVIQGDSELSYRDVDAAARRVAGVLVSAGIRPGDRVAFSCPNVAEFPIVYYGILKAGAAVVPLNVLLRGREIAYHLADSRAKVYIAHRGTAALPIGEEALEGFRATESCERLFLVGAEPGAVPEGADRLEDAMADVRDVFDTVEVDDEETAVVLYTSGTTGQPKGAELRHRNMRDNAYSVSKVFACDAARPDTYLAVLPLYHSYGQTVVQNIGFAFGGTIVMLPRFDAQEALELMRRHRVTFFSGVPTMYWGLMAAANESVDVAQVARDLRVANCGGAPLPVEMHRRFEERFGVTILEGYGLSETSPVASFNPFGREPKVGSIGVPIPDVEMKLIGDDWSDVDPSPGTVGEIAIRGHNVMKGYFGRPEATRAVIRDGWFRTGDLARRDEDGYYFIVDRSKDLIIRGGYNVYPREVEELLIQHPRVSLAAVVGVPHEALGEEVIAVVVREPGADVTEEELVAWGKERLAAYKYPRQVRFVTEMPLTSTGKILKRELKEMMAGA